MKKYIALLSLLLFTTVAHAQALYICNQPDDILSCGDGTNDTVIAPDGMLSFVGTAGLTFGSMYVHEGAVNVDISAAGADTYVKVTGLTTGHLNNVTINSDAFNVGVIGHYKVDWQMSADSQGNNLTYEADLFVNGVEEPDGSSRRKFGAAADFGSMSGVAVIEVTNVAHDIDLRIKGVSNSTDIDIFNMNFNIVQIGGR